MFCYNYGEPISLLNRIVNIESDYFPLYQPFWDLPGENSPAYHHCPWLKILAQEMPPLSLIISNCSLGIAIHFFAFRFSI